MEVTSERRAEIVANVRAMGAGSGGFVKELASAVGIRWNSAGVQRKLGELQHRIADLIESAPAKPSEDAHELAERLRKSNELTIYGDIVYALDLPKTYDNLNYAKSLLADRIERIGMPRINEDAQELAKTVIAAIDDARVNSWSICDALAHRLGMSTDETESQVARELAIRIERIGATKPDDDAISFCKRVEQAVDEHDEVELFGVLYLPAEKAIELPVDADGVPCRIGDAVVTTADDRDEHTVVGFIRRNVVCESPRSGGGFTLVQLMANELTHRKPRTLEDIAGDLLGAGIDEIEDLVHEAYEMGRKGAL